MRGTEPVDLSELQEALLNKAQIYEGAMILYENGDPDGSLEDVEECKQEYLAALATLEALPPPPVLPPRYGLCKITGKLADVTVTRCRTSFDVDVYRTSPLPAVSDEQRLVGGTAAILMGSPATTALLAKKHRPQTSSADYVDCHLEGRAEHFCGWVGMTDLKVGDSVELVVEWQDDHYQIYAITLPEERIISVCPQCDCGSHVYGMQRLNNTLIITAGLVVFYSLTSSFIESGGFINNLKYTFTDEIDFWFLFCSISFLFFGSLGIAAWFAAKKTTVKLAETIFRTLGWKDVESINLRALTKKHEKRLRRQGQWTSPKRTDLPLRPTAQSVGAFEYWYYY